MQRTLSEHIARLEERIVVLRRELRGDDLTDYLKAEREIDLANAEHALKLFKQAYDFEQRALQRTSGT